MSRGVRLGVFGTGLLGFLALLVWGLAGLPSFGDFDGHYGQLLAHLSVPARHTNSAVAATTFDFRGFDTLGESFILFTAAVGVLTLLRVQRAEEDVAAEPAHSGRPTAESRSLRSLAIGLSGPFLVLGVYVVTHGHLSPGGGFQGGVVMMSGFLLVYLAGAHLRPRPGRPLEAIERAEASGAAGFVAIGIGGLILSGAFLANFLPFGTAGDLVSGGDIPLLNIAVALEVMGALLAILGELLDQKLLAAPEEG
ncbi:MAG TPA: hydrogen gas-evolving membrane-bound hydrogenase subunit E [Solirubrobacterales bacterium]|nr:hydrogen gas-evolving membrane-bound hydrogenase subunit E [Solirubrobacterales bacterium]